MKVKGTFLNVTFIVRVKKSKKSRRQLAGHIILRRKKNSRWQQDLWIKPAGGIGA